MHIPVLATAARALVAASLALAAAAAPAQPAWANKPIRWINPHGPGGPTDVVARAIGQRVGATLGQSIVIENKPGANTLIGTEQVARSEPDGHTWLLCTQASHGTNPALQPKISYDPLKDFTPVAMLSEGALIVLVRPDSPLQNMADLLADAKKRPGKVTYASIGPGSLHHLAGEMLRLRGGVDLLHVPYRTAADNVTAMLGKEVDIIFSSGALPLIRGGKARAIGSTSPTRWPLAADVPTVAEQGMPGYSATGWFGLCVRSGTPDAIVQSINQAVVAALRDPEVRKTIEGIGHVPVGGTPAEMRDRIARELTTWAQLVRQANLKIE